MSHQYSTALSDIVLAGTGIWCLKSYSADDSFRLPHCMFGLIVTHSFIGIWRWGISDHGDKAEKQYQITRFLITTSALPCISTEVWLMYGYQKEIAYLPVVASLILLASDLVDKTNKDLIDTILIINTVSTGIVCYIHQNFYGVAAAITFGINHSLFAHDGELLDIPKADLHNYGMCFFTYFALRALRDLYMWNINLLITSAFM